MTTDTVAKPFRTDRVSTVHTLTADVANPYSEVRDKRDRERWYHKPVLEKGMRIMVTRDYSGNDQLSSRKPREYESCRVSITTERAGYYSSNEGFHYWEYRLPSETVATLHIQGDRPEDVVDESRAEKARILAKLTTTRALLAAMSEPIRDFDSVMATRDAHPESTLHRLFLMGAISLDQIEAAIQAERES